MKIFKKSDVQLGEGSVTQYIVFEHKKLFSIIFYRWNTIDQVRFHTHAFASFAFLLHGWYNETVIFNGVKMPNFVNQPLWPRWLPRNYCHAIKTARPGTITVVIAGPWQKHWYEYFPDTKTWVKYGWGRTVISSSKEAPEDI